MDQKLIVGSHIFTLKTEEPLIENGALAIDEGRIIDIGPYTQLKEKYPNFEQFGDAKTFVLPGFSNAHHHVNRTFRSGLVEEPLELWLVGRYAMENGDDEHLYLNAAYSAIELIKSGTTAVLDHYYGSNELPYFGADVLIRAYRDAGLKVTLSLAVQDRNQYVYGFSDAEDRDFLDSFSEKQIARIEECHCGAGLTGWMDFIPVWEKLYEDYAADPNVLIALGPAGLQWCTDNLLKEIRNTAEKYNVRIHTHLLESYLEKEFAIKAYGKSGVEHLEEMGLLSPTVSLAHCVWVTSRDMEILAQTGASVAHNPASNLRLYSGICPANEMIEKGVTVGIGTDGMGFNDDNDTLIDMRLCSLLQREPGVGSKGLTPLRIMQMATRDAACSIGWMDELGTISIGNRADLVLIDSDELRYPYAHPDLKPEDLIIQRASKRNIHAVFSDGELIVERGKVLSLDEEYIVDRLREKKAEMWNRTPHYKKEIVNQVKNKLRQYFEEWEGTDHRPGFNIVNTQ